MKTVNSIEKFKTSFGTAFIIECEEKLFVGQTIIIDNTEYTIKKVQMQSLPNSTNLIAVFV